MQMKPKEGWVMQSVTASEQSVIDALGQMPFRAHVGMRSWWCPPFVLCFSRTLMRVDEK